MFGRAFNHIDWHLFFAALGVSLFGLVTMYPFASGGEAFFDRQIIWIIISVSIFFLASLPEYTFLRRTQIVMALYVVILITRTHFYYWDYCKRRAATF
jgi:cell division protein FtsW (lipid II flippase)